MMKFSLLFTTLLVSCVSCQDEIAGSTPQPTSYLFNERLDQVIKDTIANHSAEISPLKIEDQTVSFYRKIGPLNITGTVGFTNNSLRGLDSIRRINDAFLAKTAGQDARLTLHLETAGLEMTSDAHAKFMGIGPRISTTLVMKHAHGTATLLYKHKTEEVTVQSFVVDEIVGLRLRILKAPGFVTPFVAKQIINRALAVFNPLVKAGVTTAGRTLLDNMVRENELVKDILTEAYGQ